MSGAQVFVVGQVRQSSTTGVCATSCADIRAVGPCGWPLLVHTSDSVRPHHGAAPVVPTPLFNDEQMHRYYVLTVA
jgi:hypothetical protein